MLRKLRNFVRAKDGMAAAEFGLILPVLLIMVFGAIEVTSALICKAEVSNTASTAADLVAQESTMSLADMSNVFTALTALIYPNSTANMKVVITSVIDDGKGGGKVDWSAPYNGATARTKGSPVTVPTGLITTGGSVILSEVTYNYRTPSNYLVKLPLTMKNTFYSHPRRVAQILWTGPGP
jgi:Flp pilus assembly protein TadG